MNEDKKYQDILEETINRMQSELEKFSADFNKSFIKPNIVLSGKTGVGKSTLINSIFGFDKAKTGEGKPVSQALIKYDVPDANVNLFDTKGIELDPEEREKSRQSIITEIKKRAESPNIEDHMHIMWYCISNESRRIEDIEMEWIREFSGYLPIIIVLTQTLDNNSTFQQIVEKECPGVPVCRVLAEEREIFDFKIPQHGLKNLINVTINILPEATKKAFIAAQKIKIEDKINSAKRTLEERLNSKSPINYKNLSHFVESFPIGLDFVGKGAVYIYIARDIMKVMGIPVSKNFFKFVKEAKPLLKSMLIPFVVSEGGRATGKVVYKYGGEKAGKRIVSFVSKLFGKTLGKGNIALSPIVGLLLGAFNRKVTEKIANAFIAVCSEFLRTQSNYEELSNEEIINILSKNMEEKMREIQQGIDGDVGGLGA